MIRRRTMLEEPDVAPDGTWCYFLSSTTLADFDPFACIDRAWDVAFGSIVESEWDLEHLPPLAGGRFGMLYRLCDQITNGANLEFGDDLVLWPTDEDRKQHRIAWVNAMLQAGTLQVPHSATDPDAFTASS